MRFDWEADPTEVDNEGIFWHHIYVLTPMGMISVEGRDWVVNEPAAKMPWGEAIYAESFNDAKELVQASWDRMMERLHEYNLGH